MSDRNRVAAFNRRLEEVRKASEVLGNLLKIEHDPVFGTVESEAIEEVNEAFKALHLPLYLKLLR